MVNVGWRSSWGTVIVLAFPVDVIVCVEVTVSLSTGVVMVETVRVGPTVTVCCGPTDREKSRSKSMGSQLPLLERIRRDQSPLYSWSLSSGLRVRQLLGH